MWNFRFQSGITNRFPIFPVLNSRSHARIFQYTCTVKLALCFLMSLFDCQRTKPYFRRSVETSILNLVLRTQVTSSHQLAFHHSQIGNALVEVRGFEPLTPALQTRCSAN